MANTLQSIIAIIRMKRRHRFILMDFVMSVLYKTHFFSTSWFHKIVEGAVVVWGQHGGIYLPKYFLVPSMFPEIISNVLKSATIWHFWHKNSKILCTLHTPFVLLPPSHFQCWCHHIEGGWNLVFKFISMNSVLPLWYLLTKSGRGVARYLSVIRIIFWWGVLSEVWSPYPFLRIFSLKQMADLTFYSNFLQTGTLLKGFLSQKWLASFFAFFLNGILLYGFFDWNGTLV